MPKDNFHAGVVRVELHALEATNTYRVYATIGDTPPVPVCDVDKARVDDGSNPAGMCQTEAERHIRAALEKHNSAVL